MSMAPQRSPAVESSHAGQDHDNHELIEQKIENYGNQDVSELERTTTPTRMETEAYSIFTVSQKRCIAALVAIASFFSPLSANVITSSSLPQIPN
jgi:hypothetical protein